VSHASEDKDAVAEPLVEALVAADLRVWYDRIELRLGDSLREKIDDGLAHSRFGIVILSPSFFAKHWPKQELNGLAQREVNGEKVILPVWYNTGLESALRVAFLRRPLICHELPTQTRDIMIGTNPHPENSGRSALPITAPTERAGSPIRIACPRVGDVASRSPTSTAPNEAST
jgi:hypothetical protein